MTVVQLIVAVVCGGLGGAVFNWFVNRRFPPILRLRLHRPEGEKGQIRLDADTLEDARFYHLRISNLRRWAPATDTQVFLIRVDEPGPDGNFRTAWVNDVPMRWRNQESSPLTRTVGTDADCDLCFLRKGKVLTLLPLIVPFRLQAQRFAKSNLALFLQARSTQADSPVFRVEISWDGEWEDGDTEIQRHLTIKVAAV
jgi:hypothetical protein